MRINKIAFIVSALSACTVWGSECKQLEPRIYKNIATFVSAQFDLAPDVTVQDKGLVDLTCYRRLEVRAAEPRRIISVYLTPDQHYLVPDLLDLEKDPLMEKRVSADEALELLWSHSRPTEGVSDSSVKIVVFTDFQCPFCRKFHNLISQLTNQEKDTIAIQTRHLPLSSHSWASQAARMSVCATRQSSANGRIVGDFLFSHQAEITAETFDQTIGQMPGQLDKEALGKCMQSTGLEELEEDRTLSERFKVAGTPTIFINGRRVRPIQSLAQLRAILDAAKLDNKERSRNNLPAATLIGHN